MHNIASLAIISGNYRVLNFIRQYWPNFTVLSRISPPAGEGSTDADPNSDTVLFTNIVKLRELGFNIASLQSAGYSDDDILTAGFSIDELRAHGYSTDKLRTATQLSVDTIMKLDLHSQPNATGVDLSTISVFEMEALLHLYLITTNGNPNPNSSASPTTTPIRNTSIVNSSNSWNNCDTPSDLKKSGGQRVKFAAVWANNKNWDNLNAKYLSIVHNTGTGAVANGNSINLPMPHGVTWEVVDVDGVRAMRVTKLLLPNNNIIGTLPPEIDTLTALMHLILNNNKISGEIPVTLGKLTKLSTLFLQHNMFTGCIPNSLSNCKQLLVIRLEHNQLTGNNFSFS